MSYETSKFCEFLRCLVDFGVDAVTGGPTASSSAVVAGLVAVSLLDAAAVLRPTDLDRGLCCLGCCCSAVLPAAGVDVFIPELRKLTTSYTTNR